MQLTKATQPTMYFIGVTTGSSSIMKVFPDWAEALGINAVMKGIDIAIHEKPEVYREVVDFIKNDPLSMGALVTTHKLDLYEAAKDMFDYLDPYALQFGELSSISKLDGKLCGHAKDPITCGMAMEEFVPENYWKENPEAGVMIMGAGGSAISMCSYYMRNAGKGNDPKKIVICNRSQPRLTAIEEINSKMNPANIPTEYYLTPKQHRMMPFSQQWARAASSSTQLASVKTDPVRRSQTMPFSRKRRSPGKSTIAETGSSRIRLNGRSKTAVYRSKMAGCISFSAGRRSSQKSSISKFSAKD